MKTATKKYFNKVATSNGDVDILVKGAVLIPIQDLNLWDDNPRYNDDAVPKLAQIFKQHGVRSAVVVWEKNMTIYKGNTTYKALKLLGAKHIPCEIQDFKSEASAKAYGIADNKSHEFSGWDEDVLSNLMQTEEMQRQKHTTGFKETELFKLLKINKTITSPSDVPGTLPKVTVIMHPDLREEVIAYLKRALRIKFGDKVVVK